MKTSAILLTAVLFLATGCSGSRYYWYHPDRTLEQAKADFDECKRKASREASEAAAEQYIRRTRSPGHAASSYNTPREHDTQDDPDYTWFTWGNPYKQSILAGCMKAKGYTRLPAHRLPDKVRTKTLSLGAIAGR